VRREFIQRLTSIPTLPNDCKQSKWQTFRGPTWICPEWPETKSQNLKEQVQMEPTGTSTYSSGVPKESSMLNSWSDERIPPKAHKHTKLPI
jgi:hypothetical protein